MCLHSNIIRGIQPLVSSKIVDRGPGAASGPRSASASPQLFLWMSNVIPPGMNNDTIYKRDNSPLSTSIIAGQFMAALSLFHVRPAT